MIPATGFLTILGRASVPDRRALRWFGPVGLGLGGLLGLAWWATTNLWPPFVAAVIVVALDLALTGMLHLDGLADTADGLLAHLDRSRRLEVMRTPDVGAFGVGATVAVLALRIVTLGSLEPRGWHAAALLGGLWAASRTLMAVAAAGLPYARNSGLASAFAGGSPWVPLLVGAPLAIGGAALWGWPALIAVAAGTLAAAGVLALALRRIGGYTGDVLGAAGLVVETVGLVVVSARW